VGVGGIRSDVAQRKHELGPKKRAFFTEVLQTLTRTGTPFLVGGGYALRAHTGTGRVARDLDIFVHPRDVCPILDVFAGSGFRVELTFPHWLGKVYKDRSYVDFIFGFGNGVAPVDDRWFEHAIDGEVLGIPVRLSPAEEMLWSKAFVMERERYDGADVIHLIDARGDDLDWNRLLERFGPHQLVLLSHLVLFLFVFPSSSARVPRWVWEELTRKLGESRRDAKLADEVCRGTLLSRTQYLLALRNGYRDARLPPEGSMRREDVEAWTEAAPVKDRNDLAVG
jgi:hypothetical protein